jgi:uncharacterized protein YkwD
MFEAIVVAAVLAGSAGTDAWLPPPPWRVVDQSHASAKAVAIDPLSRADVAAKYQQVFVPQGLVAHGWTGNVGTCTAGTTALPFHTAVIDRVNFYRALSGLPGTVAVTGNATAAANAQSAALMMSANGALSHNPPLGWVCYSSGGASGAASSNLALGRSGPGAIDLYIDDPGGGNEPVGHRRWILFPPQQAMASGDIPTNTRSNVLWVFATPGPRPATPAGVAWPPRGFVPYQVLPALSNRWSLSYPGAGFSTAVVTMSVGGMAIPVQIDSHSANGYGDNTLVWRPTIGTNAVRYGIGGVDRTYQVQVSNVTGTGVPSSFSYSVTVIDGMEPVPLPPVSLFRNGFE